MALKVSALITFNEERRNEDIVKTAYKILDFAKEQEINVLFGQNAYTFEGMLTDSSTQLNFEITENPLSKTAASLFEYDSGYTEGIMERIGRFFEKVMALDEIKRLVLYYLDSNKRFYEDDIDEIELKSTKFKVAMQDLYEENKYRLALAKFTFIDKEL